MILKSLKLENIRSYNYLELEFPEGKTLLSGDIGSGKTTILLAIEFALFGLIRGTLSGSTLLRHGKQTCNVELTFEIENQQIKISRTLKKTNNGIVQDAGYIEINGERTDSTAIELKSKILELLGYPEELLTKSKNLLFRYTAYTPQEEMKQILYESEDERLEKIRKIFDIDKYKRIKENATTYTKELRTEIRANQNLDSEIHIIKENKKEIEEKNKQVTKELDEAHKNTEEAKIKEKQLEEKIDIIKEEESKLNTLKKKQEIILIEIKNEQRNKKQAEEEYLEIKEDKIEEYAKKNTRNLQEIKEEINNLVIKQDEMNSKKIEILEKSAIYKSKKEEAKEIIKNIEMLKECPTCKQLVTEEHKKQLELEEKNKIKDAEEKEQRTIELLKKVENNTKIIKEKIDFLRKEQEEVLNEQLKQKIIEQKIKAEQEKSKRKEQLQERIKKLSELLKNKDEELKVIEEKIKEILVDEEIIKTLNQELKNARIKTRTLEIKFAELKETKRNTDKIYSDITKQLEEKTKTLQTVTKKKRIENWLSNQFINVTDTIEKHVLVSIHTQFNSYFQEWFNKLMEDETINASITDKFTPTIIQNGHETETENLSGGEKTAVALAYRLATNQVINEFMNTIKTKGLLILDEPTDGFSTHQLDKLRDVLEEVNAKQIIIVSHETKMESFVENIIRIQKREHASSIE